MKKTMKTLNNKQEFTSKILKENIEQEKMIIKGVACKLNTVTRNDTLYKKLTYIEQLPALFNHDENSVIGYVKFSEDEHNVNFEMKLNPNTTLALEVWENIKHGDLTGVSIGAYVNDYEYDEDKDVYVINQGELLELSIVATPSNREARIKSIEKIEKKEHIMNEKDYKSMSLVELIKEQEDMNIQAKRFNEQINKMTKDVKESVDDTEAKNILEDKKDIQEKLKKLNEAEETIKSMI